MKSSAKKIIGLFLTLSILTASFPFGLTAEAGGAKYTDDTIMRVGLMFGENAVESFETSAPNGFKAGYISKDDPTVFMPVLDISATRVTVARSDNLAITAAGKYYVSNTDVKLGKYHIEFGQDFTTTAEALSFIEELKTLGVTYAFICYRDGVIKVRSHDRSNAERAQQSYDLIYSQTGGKYKMEIVTPGKNALSLIEPETNDILFQVDSAGRSLALTAAQIPGTPQAYITSPAKNIYPGVFEYRRVSGGLEVINVLPLGEYVKGVLPWEVNPEWHDEALRAFSTVVRTYSLYSMKRHAKDGFMLCNEVHCQAYNGRKRSTERTDAAVDDTRDLVIAYKGELINAVYSSSVGDRTASHNEVWGGSLRLPYLVSVETPWELYELHNNAKWVNEVGGAELASYLKTTSSLKSKFANFGTQVTKIVPTYSDTSGYIIKAEIYDNKGNCVTITTADSVRIAFGRYANSANMTISYRFLWRINESGQKPVYSGSMKVIDGTNTAKTFQGSSGDVTILSAKGAEKPSTDGSPFVFDGKGWGHGVGLSQYGMLDLAESGMEWRSIIKSYYTGVDIVPAGELDL